MQAVAFEKRNGVLVAPAAVLGGREGALRSGGVPALLLFVAVSGRSHSETCDGLEKKAKAVRELFKGFREQTSRALSESID